jgi:hypothetical protein
MNINIHNRIPQAEERICKLKYILLENIELGENRIKEKKITRFMG